MTPQYQARCDAYRQLMEEYCDLPKSERSNIDYMLAKGYIAAGNPDHARYHLIHAGVPQDLVLAVDALVT